MLFKDERSIDTENLNRVLWNELFKVKDKVKCNKWMIIGIIFGIR